MNARQFYAEEIDAIAIDPVRQLFNGNPSTLTSWIDGLGLTAGARVLHVGCGTGCNVRQSDVAWRLDDAEAIARRSARRVGVVLDARRRFLFYAVA